MHAAGLLHRDIKPGNIYLRSGETASGKAKGPMLIDFGAARMALGEHSKSITNVVSEGYAPTEQYSSHSKQQGPWSDLYGLGATLYHCISGQAPIDAPHRQESVFNDEPDPLIPAMELGKARYSKELLTTVDRLLAIRPKQRPQSVMETLALLGRAEPEVPIKTKMVEEGDKGFGNRAAKPRAEAPRFEAAGSDAASAPKNPEKPGGSLRPMLIGFGLVAALVLGVAVTFIRRWVTLGRGDKAIQITLGTLVQKPVENDLLEKLGMKFVDIPGGGFNMGSEDGDEDEMPVHWVDVASFRLMAHEVTRGQFAAFVSAAGYKTDAERNFADAEGCYVYSSDGWGYKSGRDWRNPGFTQNNNHPVVCVSHNDAKEFIKWLNQETGENYRLPSEAEWEYAARAGSTAKYTFGDNEAQLCGYGNGADQSAKAQINWQNVNSCDDGYANTAPVGSFRANGWGLYDMHGNVWEWTEDCWNDSYKGAPKDGGAWLSGDCGKRVVRGGSWYYEPARLRSASRGRDGAAIRGSPYGFRLAQDGA